MLRRSRAFESVVRIMRHCAMFLMICRSAANRIMVRWAVNFSASCTGAFDPAKACQFTGLTIF